MNHHTLTAIAPVDGRYHNKTHELKSIFSEYGLIKHRVIAEIRWLQALMNHDAIQALNKPSVDANAYLEAMINQFSEADAQRIKAIEVTTNHDVKAVEYFIKEKLQHHDELKTTVEFIHFACTSEDINNIAYALMLKSARDDVFLPYLDQVIEQLTVQAHLYADIAMLSHTHGQAASPTTVGKELANFVARLKRQRQQFIDIKIMGKMNGAVGNFNVHCVAYPTVDWQDVAKQCITDMGLEWNAYTTQIEPHDYIAELMHVMLRIHTILIDYARDTWAYISKAYFQQKLVANEVGSSTMPHKVNPIDFENAEGNLGLANAICQHMANALMTSRLQRDLTDSTLLRNLGLCFGYSLIALKALLKGMNKLQINQAKITQDLQANWAVLGEALQTVMRRDGLEKPYEQLKQLTRGQTVDQATLIRFIDNLALPAETKAQLKQLSPENYIGIAAQLAKAI